MAGQDGLALSNFGMKVYMSEIGVKPVAADHLKGLVSISGFGWETDTVDATTLDEGGFARFVATLKRMTPTVLGFNIQHEDTYKKCYTRWKKDTSASDYYCDITFVFPKRADWTSSRDVTVTMGISSFVIGDIDVGSIQTFNVTFVSQSAPKDFVGPVL